MTVEEIRRWLCVRLGSELRLPATEIDSHRPVADLGLNSEVTVRIAAELQELLERPLGPDLLYSYSTIDELAGHLGGAGLRTNTISAMESEKESIAIVGIGCRFPGSIGPKGFFEMLLGGRDGVVAVPPDRWNAEETYDPDPRRVGKTCSRWGGFLSDLNSFDAAAFSILPQEAKRMDPQQRWLLEASWHAMEDAGVDPVSLAGTRTGVFVGISLNEYGHAQYEELENIDAVTPAANALSIAANRISYVFDLHGPSIAVDTACSSSLAAVHYACQSLHRRESSLAIVGGVNALLSPNISIAFSKAGLMSPDGKCKPFERSANGYVRGEGVGVVVLKRLSEALRDNNDMYAVILGSAISQDGRSNGLMAPRGSAQEEVILAACRDAGIAPQEVDFVEAHGTGTAVGDVIEANALGSTIGRGRRSGGKCYLGSVKSNIGHLESAAGIAGFIKTALSIRHKTIVPTIHYAVPNPAIHFEELGLQVNVAPLSWPKRGSRRIGGVSSFGFGGTNVHVVMAESNSRGTLEAESVAAQPLGLALSAPTTALLHECAVDALDSLKAEVSDDGQRRLIEASIRRHSHPHRLAVLAREPCDISRELDNYLTGAASGNIAEGDAKGGPLAFVFSGQGAIWPGAGRDLFDKNPIFRTTLLDCDASLRAHLGSSILPALFGSSAEAQLEKTEWAQPALFAVQVALAAVLRSWGLVPSACVGHSVGEIAAACCSGAFDTDLGARIVALRGAAMKDSAGNGRMFSLVADKNAVESFVRAYGERIDIAAENGPNSFVLSGDSDAIRAAFADSETRGLQPRWLPLNYAFHSVQMTAAAKLFRSLLGDLPQRALACPLYSGSTGTLLEASGLSSEYWADAIRRTVNFSNAIKHMVSDGITTFIEVGPQPLLLRDIESASARGGIRSIGTLRRKQPGEFSLIQTAAALYVRGHLPSLERAGVPSRHLVGVPPRRWEQSIHWFQPPKRKPPNSIGSFFDTPFRLAADPSQMIWQGHLDVSALQLLNHHRLFGEAILPAAAYLAMFAQAFSETQESEYGVLEEVRFLRLLPLPTDGIVPLQMTFKKTEDYRGEYQIHAKTGTDDASQWLLCATAKAGHASGDEMPMQTSVDEVRSRCLEHYPAPLFYRLLASRGFEYGPAFRLVNEVFARRGESLAKIERPAHTSNPPDHAFDLVVLDSCFHAVAASFGARMLSSDDAGLLIPRSIDRFVWRSDRDTVQWSHVYLRELSNDDSNRERTGDISVLNKIGEPVIYVRGFSLFGSSKDIQQQRKREAALAEWLYRVSWIKRERESNQTSTALPEAALCLILCDEMGIGDELADRIELEGGECLRVRRKPNPARHDCRDYVVALESPAGLRAVMCEFEGREWSLVINLWGIPGGESSGDDALEVPISVAYLIQAMQSAGIRGQPQLFLITRGAISVLPEELGDPLASMMWGMAKALVFEHPDVACRRIDLDGATTPSVAALALLEELRHKDVDDQVVFRGSDRFVPRLRRYEMKANVEPHLERDATYLIVGGFGALGRRIATRFVEMGAGTIVVTSRSEPPAQLVESLTEGKNSARVIAVSTDISDPVQVQELMKRIASELPPLRGIVHAAGTLDDCAILNLTRERLLGVVRPKVLGALHLGHVLQSFDLSFFILCSSAASILGSPGQASYCAANAFLDAYALSQSNNKSRILSISWSAWEGGGRGGQQEDRPKLASSRLFSMIPADTGLDLLAQLIASEKGHIAVLPFSVRSLVQFYPSNAGLEFFRDLMLGDMAVVRNDGAKEAVYRRPNLAREYLGPRTEIEQSLVGMWQSSLGMTGIGIQDELFELGGDSVLASQLLSQISQKYAVRISQESAFSSFTIETLARLIDDALLDRVQHMDDDTVELMLIDREKPL